MGTRREPGIKGDRERKIDTGERELERARVRERVRVRERRDGEKDGGW